MNLVNYEDVIDIVFDNCYKDLEDILDLLSALPKIDIVRCKDCKHMKHVLDKGKNGICGALGALIIMSGNDYCSYGERKNNGELD